MVLARFGARLTDGSDFGKRPTGLDTTAVRVCTVARVVVGGMRCSANSLSAVQLVDARTGFGVVIRDSTAKKTPRPAGR